MRSALAVLAGALGIYVIAVIAVIFSGVITGIIGYALKATMGWRISPEAETRGIDLSEHSETAYENPTAAARLT